MREHARTHAQSKAGTSTRTCVRACIHVGAAHHFQHTRRCQPPALHQQRDRQQQRSRQQGDEAEKVEVVKLHGLLAVDGLGLGHQLLGEYVPALEGEVGAHGRQEAPPIEGHLHAQRVARAVQGKQPRTAAGVPGSGVQLWSPIYAALSPQLSRRRTWQTSYFRHLLSFSSNT